VLLSLNWVKKYVDLSDITNELIIEKITACGLEVEEVNDLGKVFENFIVGYVEEKIKHPNADKLSLCKVSDGSNIYDVVCGAPNVASGQKIILAKIGAVIPKGGFVISKAKIRGAVSEGMICSDSELGISDDHSGIKVLDESAVPGTSFADFAGKNDIIIEISVTPNRPDALSHFGVARELAAIFNRPVNLPETHSGNSSFYTCDECEIEILDTEGCPRYVGKVVKNIKVKESPEWLKRSLSSIGLRPINNIVDVTNYVLHEIGQPLHAFDLKKLSGKKIVVRSAEAGKEFVTLDSKKRTLNSSDLMICDGEKEVAVAGVMGGENSEVDGSTTDILIESAYFNPSRIRKTAKKLGLSTDASYRFERGCNPDMTIWAAERAAELILEVAGGVSASDVLDVYPIPIEKKQATIRYKRVDSILGYHINPAKVKEILLNLGFIHKSETSEDVTFEIPGFRPDVEREIDLIEEVARIYGYDLIPPVDHVSVSMGERIDQREFKNNIRKVLSGLGFYEIYTNSMQTGKIAGIFGKPIPVMNPQTTEMSHIRTSLIPGMLDSIARNLRVRENDFLFYEIGDVMSSDLENKFSSFDEVSEETNLLICAAGKVENTEWYAPEKQYDFFDLKGYFNELISALRLKNPLSLIRTESDDNFELRFEISGKSGIFGIGGKLSKKLCDSFEINIPVFLFEISVNKLENEPKSEKSYSELLKYPKVIRDFAVVLDKNIIVEKVIEVIKNSASSLLKNIKLFDIFEGESIGEGNKSLAFELEFYEYSRTLVDTEIDEEFWKIIGSVKRHFNAKLRGEN